MKIHLFLVACSLFVLLAPNAMAGPLPDPHDLPDADDVGDHIPSRPNDADSYEYVEKILKELLPGEGPYQPKCIKSDERSYDPDQYPGSPVTTVQSEDSFKVQIWHDKTVYEIIVDKKCMSD